MLDWTSETGGWLSVPMAFEHLQGWQLSFIKCPSQAWGWYTSVWGKCCPFCRMWFFYYWVIRAQLGRLSLRWCLHLLSSWHVCPCVLSFLCMYVLKEELWIVSNLKCIAEMMGVHFLPRCKSRLVCICSPLPSKLVCLMFERPIWQEHKVSYLAREALVQHTSRN